MSNSYFQLRRIAFSGPKRIAEMTFSNGVNVICGASDTGKSFLAESIDFMLGGAELRDIPERTPFGEVEFDLDVTSGEKWRFCRATLAETLRLRICLMRRPNLRLSEKIMVTEKPTICRDSFSIKSGFLGNAYCEVRT